MKPIVVTRLLASYWQEGEEARQYERKKCLLQKCPQWMKLLMCSQLS